MIPKIKPTAGNQIREEENFSFSLPGRGIIVKVLKAVINPLMGITSSLPVVANKVHLTPKTVRYTLYRGPYTALLCSRLNADIRKRRHFIENLKGIFHDLHRHGRPRTFTETKI